MAHEVYKINGFEKRNISLKLLYITHSAYDKGWHSTPHTHHFTELFYIVNGRGAFILPNHEIPVKENDLVIINPNIEHTEKSNTQDSLEYIALGLEGISFTLPDASPQIGLFTYQGDRDAILFYLNRLLEEVQYGNSDFETVCQNIIEILVIKLQRAKNIIIHNHKAQQLSQPIVLVKHYINQNYRDQITLDILAKVGNINKYYLSHTFKQEVGISPIEYLTRVRIKESQILLETTNYTIAEIALFNGFSSQSFFSQAFRREVNQSPSAFRKQSQCKHEHAGNTKM